MSCHDPKTGGFADAPGGKPDVPLTAVGVMAAIELEVPKEKFRKAMDYLKDNAKTFEDVRIGAAAVEAWGVKDCPIDWKPWVPIAIKTLTTSMDGSGGPVGGGAVDCASPLAMLYRLGLRQNKVDREVAYLRDGQWTDGGWIRAGQKSSDLDATYRVMRAFYLLKEKPKDVAKLREFIAKCRNADGGYGVKPGEKSTVGGVYYAAIVTRWLDEMEK
jgi:prenyltransferase beta subunit